VVIEISDEMFARFVLLAESKTCVEMGDESGYGYNPGESGSSDDAYSDGSGDGQIDLARAFLDNLGINYKK
jgi:hypothetical protein